jgi:carboxyl-terminal processing protease
MTISRSILAAALWLALAPAAHAAETTVTLPRAEMEQLLGAYKLIKQQYVDTVDDKKLLTDAMGGMLASLDPHSQYLNKDDLLELEKNQTGEYVGIGMEVEFDRGKMVVLGLTEGGPAASKGIRPADVIVAIDGRAVSGLHMNEVSRRMRGLPGSLVEVSVSRPRETALRTFSVMRAALHSNTVTARTVAPGLAWIRISAFGGATSADLATELKKLDVDGGPKGLILDLRNDPGGLITAAVGVAAAFLPPDTVLFSSRGRMPGSNVSVTVDERYFKTSAADEPAAAWARQVPLTVLVNGASASAAELLAGAIQDNKRGIVIGTQTFGKGSIQSIIPLSENSAIKMTVARYYTPNGREIQARGITPDVLVKPSAASTASQSVQLREADFANHLPATLPVAETSRAAAEDSQLFGTRDDKALQVAIDRLAPSRSLALGDLVRRWRAVLRTSWSSVSS